MKLQELIASIHVPYRNAAFGVMFLGSITFGIFVLCFSGNAVSPNLYWISYAAILLMFIGIMYLTFWVYKAGYKKRALLMAIAYIALFAISLVAMMSIFDRYDALRPLLP